MSINVANKVLCFVIIFHHRLLFICFLQMLRVIDLPQILWHWIFKESMLPMLLKDTSSWTDFLCFNQFTSSFSFLSLELWLQSMILLSSPVKFYLQLVLTRKSFLNQRDLQNNTQKIAKTMNDKTLFASFL